MPYNRIKEMRDDLIKLQAECKSLYKKHGKATSGLQNTSIAIAAIAAAETTANITTSLTVMRLP